MSARKSVLSDVAPVSGRQVQKIDMDVFSLSGPGRTLQAGPVDLVFSDPVSELGAQVSMRAAMALGAVIGLLVLMSLIPKRRTVTAPDAVH